MESDKMNVNETVITEAKTIVYAFVDIPVELIWISREGKVVGSETHKFWEI